jgi:hypothetical protein
MVREGHGALEKDMLKKFLPILFLFAGFQVNAAIIIDVNEVGGNVSAYYSGSIDLSSTLGKEADRNSSNPMNFWSTGADGAIQYYMRNGSTDDYNLNMTSYSGGALFSVGWEDHAGTFAGDAILFDINAASGYGQVWLKDDYISGEEISGEFLYSGHTFASMHINTGVYHWTWENSGNTDSLTVRVGQASTPIPEPSIIALFAVGLVGIGFVRRRKA